MGRYFAGGSSSLILDPLLFNIFLYDLFLTKQNTDLTSYADDDTPYSNGENIDDIIGTLEETPKFILI